MIQSFNIEILLVFRKVYLIVWWYTQSWTARLIFWVRRKMKRDNPTFSMKKWSMRHKQRFWLGWRCGFTVRKYIFFGFSYRFWKLNNAWHSAHAKTVTAVAKKYSSQIIRGWTFLVIHHYRRQFTMTLGIRGPSCPNCVKECLSVVWEDRLEQWLHLWSVLCLKRSAWEATEAFTEIKLRASQRDLQRHREIAETQRETS